MSDSDSFIEEVTEEVRREQLFKYVRKYGWVAVVLVLGVVGVTGYLEYRKAQQANAAQELGDKIVAALDGETAQDRAISLALVSANAGDARVVVDMRRASELIEAGDTEGALALFDAIANSGASPAYTDMALLKGVILRGADQDAAERDAVLEQLAAPGAIYRPLALEQQALTALARGDTEKAIELFQEVYLDSEATNNLVNRTRQVLVSLGGEVPPRVELTTE